MGPEFDRVAAEYAAFRMGYSSASVDAIAREAGPDAAVLDVATGTGLLADQLRPRVRLVAGGDVALAMLRAARPPVAQARAEALPFRSGAFDAVTCAQAFHWLDRARAAGEFRRVLRPGGLVAVLWKYPVADEPYDELAMRLIEERTGPYPRAGRGDPDLAFLGDVREIRTEWSIDWTVDAYVGWMSSRESVRQRAGEGFGDFLAEFRRRLDALVGGKPFRERNVDRLFLVRNGPDFARSRLRRDGVSY